MEESANDGLKSSLGFLFSIPEFKGFYETFSIENKVNSKNDLYLLIDKFKLFLSEIREISADENIIFNHIVECAENQTYINSNEKIFIVNQTKIPNENFLIEFIKNFNATKTDDLLFEEINKGKYKTVSEHIALYGIDGGKLYDK